MLGRTATLSVMLLLLGTALGHAHKISATRKVIVTVKPASSGVSAEALVWMRLGGQRGARFVSQFDLDKDGQLNSIEARQLADTLGPEAVGGLYLAWDGETIKPVAAESKARLVAPRGVEVAILLSYAPRPMGAGRLRVATHSGRDRIGTHPHVGEVGAIPPLKVHVGGASMARIRPRKLTPKRPIDVLIRPLTPPGKVD